MIPRLVTVGRIRGIPVEIERSWFLLLLLVVFFAMRLSGSSLRLEWSQDMVFGIVASAFFFLSLFLHELGHSVVALRFGLSVKSIKFLIFGGLTELGKKPESAAQELTIALAGPVVSATIGVLLLMISDLLPTQGWIDFAAHLLGRINLLLAAFNLVPVFPLDGGRALRALLWKASGNYKKGTRQARICARLIADGLILAGGVCVLLYSVLPGLLAALAGWRLKGMTGDRDRDSMIDPSGI